MSRRVKVNMTGVESYSRCPEGEWIARLKKIDECEIQGSGDDGLKAQFEVINGEAKGCTVFETFSLSEKALWKLKSCLDAIGMKSNGKLTLDLDKMEGKTCVIDVIHDEYNGVKRAKISSYNKPNASDLDDDDEDEDVDDEDEDDEAEEEEKPVKKAKKTTKKAKKPEPEEDEEDEDEEEEPPKKVKKTAKKTTKKAKKQPEPEPEDDDDDDDDWEEDDD